MSDHRTESAAMHAKIGGELRHEGWSSELLVRPARDDEPQQPRARAAVNNAGLWYLTVIDADADLTLAIMRLVQEARAKQVVSS